MHVLLDLYGVLLDHEKTFRGYRDRLAALLAARFGSEADDWRRAHALLGVRIEELQRMCDSRQAETEAGEWP